MAARKTKKRKAAKPARPYKGPRKSAKRSPRSAAVPTPMMGLPKPPLGFRWQEGEETGAAEPPKHHALLVDAVGTLIGMVRAEGSWWAVECVDGWGHDLGAQPSRYEAATDLCDHLRRCLQSGADPRMPKLSLPPLPPSYDENMKRLYSSKRAKRWPRERSFSMGYGLSADDWEFRETWDDDQGEACRRPPIGPGWILLDWKIALAEQVDVSERGVCVSYCLWARRRP